MFTTASDDDMLHIWILVTALFSVASNIWFVASVFAGAMLCLIAEKENGEKAFMPGDAIRLQRELPEEILNQLELFLFNVAGDIEIEEAKND